MIGFRNMLVHDYLDVNRDILETIIEKAVVRGCTTDCSGSFRYCQCRACI